MNYNRVWKTLENLMIDLRKKGELLPPTVVEDLRAAKTLVSLTTLESSSQDTSHLEIILSRIESQLLYLAESKFGKEYALAYLSKIQEARLNQGPPSQPFTTFIPGIPRGEHWVRLKMEAPMNRHDVEMLADSLHLSYRWQTEDLLIIHGDKEKIKQLIKQITDEIKGKNGEIEY